MSKVQLAGNASGTGIFTIASPNSNIDRTLTLPDNTGTLLTTASAVTRAQLPVGTVLQVLQSVKVDTATSSSSSYIDINDLSVTITPTSSSNKILIIVDVKGSADITSYIQVRLLRGGTQIYGGNGTYPTLAYSYTTSGDGEGRYSVRQLGGTFLDSPATTSATTYKIQGRSPDAGNFYINRSEYQDAFAGSCASSITVMEIAA
jgi:hypothetical protein